MKIEWVKQPEGYKAMDGPHLVCRLTTKSQTEKEIDTVNGKNRLVVWEDMAPSEWSVHWAAANLPLAAVQAVVESLPKTA